MTATQQIVNELAKFFVELDAKMVADQQEWAKKRVAAIREYKADPSHRTPQGRLIDQYKYYDGLFRVAGGKTWYNVFDGRNEAMINDFIAKNCKAIAESRNNRIVAKLEGVTSVTGSSVQRSNDGFHGFFKVETNIGPKTITIDTIYAGGYNIQCYHQRTLVKLLKGE